MGNTLFDKLAEVGDLINVIMTENNKQAQEEDAVVIYGVVMGNGEGGTSCFGKAWKILALADIIAKEALDDDERDEELS